MPCVPELIGFLSLLSSTECLRKLHPGAAIVGFNNLPSFNIQGLPGVKTTSLDPQSIGIKGFVVTARKLLTYRPGSQVHYVGITACNTNIFAGPVANFRTGSGGVNIQRHYCNKPECGLLERPHESRPLEIQNGINLSAGLLSCQKGTVLRYNDLIVAAF